MAHTRRVCCVMTFVRQAKGNNVPILDDHDLSVER